MIEVVKAVVTVALVTELSVRETIAVEFEALRLCAVARLAGPHGT